MKKIIFLFFCVLLNNSIAYAWKPIFIGHRGGYTGVQNTVEAYINGVNKYGYDGLECDVRVTKDGEYVISHDETTNSLGGNLTVASATLAQLKAETLKQTRGGVAYTGKICTVAEYLAICKQYNVIPVIELKWTTGINSNSMTNFPGLYKLVSQYGLLEKVIFLTSMKPSLEYIRTNYPKVRCQFLTGEYWANHFDWCVKWGIEPSIQTGYFDEDIVDKFHKAGLPVAMWTVNSKDNYSKYGKWGVAMITCDYLYKNEMPELPNKNWGDIVPLNVSINMLYSSCIAQNNLSAGFPSTYSGDNSSYKSAYQATAVDGTIYSNDCNTKSVVNFKLGHDAKVMQHLQGSSSYGICSDDASNLIFRDDNNSDTPSRLVLYKYGETTKTVIDFSLIHNGKVHYISASGDIFSEKGGYVYFYPNGQKYVNILRIANGKLINVSASKELSVLSSNSIVVPINNNPEKFYHHVRNKGIYLYDGEDKGLFLESGSTQAPGMNISGGSVAFTLDGHELLLYPSGSNYNGGFSIMDVSAYKKNILNISELGNKGIKGNQSYSAFFKVEKISDKTVHIYEYCMGNGIALYELTTDLTLINNVKSDSKFRFIRKNTSDLKIIFPEPFIDIQIYRLNGMKVYEQHFLNKTNEQMINASHLAKGVYLIKIHDKSFKINI